MPNSKRASVIYACMKECRHRPISWWKQSLPEWLQRRAMSYGIKSEVHALEAVEEQYGCSIADKQKAFAKEGVECKVDGLLIIAGNTHLLEVKCPFKLRKSKDLRRFYKGKARHDMVYYDWQRETFSLNRESKQGAKYYHQIQASLFASELDRCLLFIWTPHDTLSVLVPKDSKWHLLLNPGDNS
jgi:hypothetical protein